MKQYAVTNKSVTNGRAKNLLVGLEYVWYKISGEEVVAQYEVTIWEEGGKALMEVSVANDESKGKYMNFETLNYEAEIKDAVMAECENDRELMGMLQNVLGISLCEKVIARKGYKRIGENEELEASRGLI